MLGDSDSMSFLLKQKKIFVRVVLTIIKLIQLFEKTKVLGFIIRVNYIIETDIWPSFSFLSKNITQQ